MSVESHSVQEHDRDLKPSSVFERYVETDPMTCNGCFARPLPEETDGVDVEDKGRIADCQHSAKYHWEEDDYCPVCGSMGLTSPDDTLSIERASRRAIRLSTRLQERGIAHSWQLLVWFVRRAKRDEDLCGKDQQIAARAVEFAVSQAH